VKCFRVDTVVLQIPTDLHLKEFKPTAVLEVSFPQVPHDEESPAPVPIKFGGAQLPENSKYWVL